MGKKYVVNGAQLECSMGAAPGNLMVTPGRTVSLGGKPLANIMDHKPGVNLPGPFPGPCKAIPPTPAGPVPCPMPVCPAPWIGGKTDVMAENFPALLEDGKLMCALGGMITVKNSGQ